MWIYLKEKCFLTIGKQIFYVVSNELVEFGRNPSVVRQDALCASLEEGNDLLFGSSLCEI